MGTGGCASLTFCRFTFPRPILWEKMLGYMVQGFNNVVFGTVSFSSNDTFCVVARALLSHHFINRVHSCVDIDWCARNCVYIRLFAVFSRVSVNTLAT